MVDLDNEQFKRTILKTLLMFLNGRLEQLEELKKFNGRLDKEILDTKNDIVRYKHMLEELDGTN